MAPRPEFPRVLRHRNLGPVAGDPSDDPADERVWSLNCFYIAAGHRRQGVAGQLVAAAVGHAARWGARAVEAYPVDRASSASGDLYTGTPGLFVRAGFTEVRRRHPSRPVFRLDLTT